MKILIAGASGFIGRALTQALIKDHQLAVVGRSMKRLEAHFDQTIEKITWENLTHHDATSFDVIINLSGSNIGAKRWTDSVKKELIESRTFTNKLLIDWLLKQNANPHYFCANAVGMYGAYDANEKKFTEDDTADTDRNTDFLRQICLAWEQSLKPAIDHGIKVTTLRFGVVLKKGEGMLKKLELSFYLGLGSVLGTGQQMISWIHYLDLVNALKFLLTRLDVTGAINITSPHPVSQKEFAIQFAEVLRRPLFLKMPPFLIKTLFGEMGEYLLLKGQSVSPKRLTELGFTFTYPDLVMALKEEYQ